MPENFIVKKIDSGWWIKEIKPLDENGEKYAYSATFNRNEAKVYREGDLEFWEKQKGFRVVEIGQDELMARSGQPRLEGF